MKITVSLDVLSESEGSEDGAHIVRQFEFPDEHRPGYREQIVTEAIERVVNEFLGDDSDSSKPPHIEDECPMVRRNQTHEPHAVSGADGLWDCDGWDGDDADEEPDAIPSADCGAINGHTPHPYGYGQRCDGILR